jgi:hypothetical protein
MSAYKLEISTCLSFKIDK